MLTIGLTGGIGCGKTTVTQIFQLHGAPVVDADEIAHDLVQPEKSALKNIVQTFGQNFLQNDGRLNRKMLREHVFNAPNEKKKLETILHPLIFSQMQKQLGAADFPYGIMSVPLLFETGFQHNMNRVLVIDCPEETQINRVITRDCSDKTSIIKIIQQQCSRDYRLAHADDIINNDGSKKSLNKQIEILHRLYLKISTGNTPEDAAE